MYSIDFVKNNWVEWFVPNIILLIVFYFIRPVLVHLKLLVMYLITLFRLLAHLFHQNLFTYIIGQVWFSYFMIYKSISI